MRARASGSKRGRVSASARSSTASLAVPGQGLQIAVEGIQARIEPQPDGQVLQAGLESLGVQFAGALVQETGQVVGQSLLARGVERGAAAEGEAEGDQGVAGFADQPGDDAAGGLHPLHRHGGGRRRGRQGRQDRQGGDGGEEPGHRRPGHRPDRESSSASSSRAVTEDTVRKTARAAAFTSSTVTASMRLGQTSTSATVRPAASAPPTILAPERRESRA